ncbi:MAG: Rrf2 family transcriptional regulator [Sedimentisphaerales bacterium]|nr:Rrf2 family transcriptional regulator [Sedimentisphaerales bacterium]
MKIGRSTGYALLATCHIAGSTDKKTVMSQDISREYDIPLEYLLKILQQLVRGNILRSKRGPRGGFSLAKPAKKITMLQIIEAVDGPMVSHMSLADYTRRANFSIKADKAFDKALSQARVVFKNITLANLIEGK